MKNSEVFIEQVAGMVKVRYPNGQWVYYPTMELAVNGLSRGKSFGTRLNKTLRTKRHGVS
jgi:hypothetical protein